MSHTKGKWKVKIHNVECVRGGIKVTLAHCGLTAVKYSDRRGYIPAIHRERDKEVAANACLMASSREMNIILELMALGLASIKRSKTRELVEFVFDGLRYVCTDRDWPLLVEIIGCNNLEAAIAAAK